MEKVIKQVNFPKLVLPFSAVVAGIVNFTFGLIPLFALMLLFYADRFSIWLVTIPLVAVVQLVFTLAMATVLSAVNVFYRDVGNLARHVLRFWFYLSPGLYGADQLTKLAEKFNGAAFVMSLNPWTTLFTAYRDAIYDMKSPDFLDLAILLAASTALLALAILAFKRAEPSFAKVL
jgi:ABC-type polysaccharide/polyol phosphate export permease